MLLEGTVNNDSLVGGIGDDQILGDAGDDTLWGEAGHDTLIGYLGNDTLWGGEGNDNLQSGEGADTVLGEDGDDFIDGYIGDDSLSGGTGNDTLAGWDGEDILKADEGEDLLFGGSDDDHLNGGTGNDEIFGGGGGDELLGGDGVDWLHGDDGDDALNGGFGDDMLFGGTGADVMIGAGGADHLIGGVGDDRLDGGTDDDTLFGEGGSDSVFGNSGADIVYGGLGDDRFVDGGDGNDQAWGRYGHDTVFGGAGDDLVYGDVDPLGTGARQFAVFAFDASGADLAGPSGTITVHDINGPVVMEAADDDDLFQDVSSEGGSDVDASGQTLAYGVTVGGITYETGTPIYAVSQSLVANATTGQEGRAWLIQFGLDPTARAWAFDIPVRVGDQITWTTAPDATDTTGLSYEDLIQADGSTAVGNDTLHGGDGNDTLFGADGRDRLEGDAGNDTLFGGEGNDSLSGGTGDDWLDGGAGLDAAVFADPVARYVIEPLADGSVTVTDMSGGPKGSVDTLLSIEQLLFADAILNADGSVVNSAPVVGKVADRTFAEDTAFTFTVPASTDAEGDDLTYAARLEGGQDLPSWLSFDAATLTFTGTPPADAASALNIEIEVSDGVFKSSATFGLVIAAVNDAPVLDAIADQTRVEDAGAWSFQVPAATDVDSVVTYTAALADGAALPSWLAFNASTRTFSGTPPKDFAGTVGLRITASDGALSASQSFNLVVRGVNDAPTDLSLGTSLVREFASNGAVVGTLSAQDVDSALFTYTLLNSAGGRFTLSGNKVVVADGLRLDFEQSASHVIRVQVSDGQGGVRTESLTISVTDVSPEVVTGDARANTFVGGSGRDVLAGLGGNDTLLGGGGADRLDGGVGTDRLEGGAGSDIYVLAAAGDTIVELAGGGTDQVQASVGVTALAANVENLVLTGTSALNGAGNGLANRLTGNGAANSLSGLAGSDALLGGAGHDRLTGGVGNDVFVFASRAEAGDVITDFHNNSGDNDRIQIDASAFGGGLLAGARLTASQFQAADDAILQGTAERGVRFIWEKDATKLWFDSNGSGAGGLTLVADLQTGAAVTAGDIWLI
ncbi:hypothetical protein FHG66_13845 [Rubellimicrobium rubrum]|uniref:Cadherin domain-containing protein n=1 Tax=Rubellimicrobium rubrum TaxID=2585369 RepID=A0A5C4MS95_9RHOB|nr:putative Ig domain-containing protein [Rubellimicrobium rubrum]TNC48433.1 hypothetical protein FHG66_13845 [Rubellimicrobium rubrum]